MMTHVVLILLVAAFFSLHQTDACADCVEQLQCYVGAPSTDDYLQNRGFEDWTQETCDGADLCLRLVRHSQPNTVELHCANASTSDEKPALGCQIVDDGTEQVQRCICNTAYCNKDQSVLPDQEHGPKWNPQSDVEWGDALHLKEADTVDCYSGEMDLVDFVTGQRHEKWTTMKCESSDRCMRVIRRETPNRVELKCGREDSYLKQHPLGCQMLEDDVGEMQRCYCKKDLCNSQPSLLPGSHEGLQWSQVGDVEVLHCYVCTNKAAAECEVEACAEGVTACVQHVTKQGVTRRMCGELGEVYTQGCDKHEKETRCFCETDLCNKDGDDFVLRADDATTEANTTEASGGVDLRRDVSVLFVAFLQVLFT